MLFFVMNKKRTAVVVVILSNLRCHDLVFIDKTERVLDTDSINAASPEPSWPALALADFEDSKLTSDMFMRKWSDIIGKE